jgi:hypothetical protein
MLSIEKYCSFNTGYLYKVPKVQAKRKCRKENKREYCVEENTDACGNMEHTILR